MPNAYPTTPKWLMTSDLLADVDAVLSRPQVWPILAFGSCVSSNSLQEVGLLSPLQFVHKGQGHAVLTAVCRQPWMEFDLGCMPLQNWCTRLFAAVWKKSWRDKLQYWKTWKTFHGADKPKVCMQDVQIAISLRLLTWRRQQITPVSFPHNADAQAQRSQQGWAWCLVSRRLVPIWSIWSWIWRKHCMGLPGHPESHCSGQPPKQSL